MTTTARTARTAASNAAALDAFIAAKAEIEASLATLQALAADHFGTHPDKITWADVGTLTHYAAQLKNLTDSATGAGEYASR